jgi:hypothetical protein
MADSPEKIVFWHRELPPLDADVMGGHTIEATSRRIPGTLARHDDLWRECEHELMANTETRLREEIARLGGRYAHVLEEVIEPHHDVRTGESWLGGRFEYALYR